MRQFIVETPRARVMLIVGYVAAENDWQLPQAFPEPLPRLRTTPEYRYGFLDMHTGYFRHVEHTENEINELGGDAETCAPYERRRRRLKHENEKWDEEYYMQAYHPCMTDPADQGVSEQSRLRR